MKRISLKYALVLASLISIILIAGCTQGADTEGTENLVELSHTYFSPSELTINAGDTVTFRNLELMSHPLFNEEAGLDTGAFLKGEYSFTFDAPGTYTVTNAAHGTTMTVVVR
jgi:plastocyanin